MNIDQTVASDQIEAIAEEAYVFSFPMLMGYRFAFGSFLSPSLPSYRGPINEMHGEAVTLGPDFKDVITPNADTPYSFALLDLRAEPMILDVPQVDGRYYVMQLEDLFGTNAHYVGSRATGSQPGSYLLAGPGFEGEAGEGFDAVLRFDTDLVFVLGRTQLLSSGDTDALQQVMDGYSISPLSSRSGESVAPAPPVDWPAWNEDASRDERFIAYLNFLLTFCQPVHAEELELMERLALIGIGAGRPADLDRLDPGQRSAIRSGVEGARARIADAAENLVEPVNGWMATEAFGDREWFGGNYLLRAAGAMAGWGGNDKAEAFYPIARVDSQGRELEGAHGYQLRLESPPPAKAFWSVTIYDTSYDGTAGYLVENPIDRYLISSTTEGLSYAEDGSLTIRIQNERPDSAEEQANWLPAPEGSFYLVLRIYWPEPPALDGTWQAPAVERPSED